MTSYNINVNNGRGILQIPSGTLPNGEYTVSATYQLNDYYNNSDTVTHSMTLTPKPFQDYSLGVGTDTPFNENMFTHNITYFNYSYGYVDTATGEFVSGNYDECTLSDYPLEGNFLLMATILGTPQRMCFMIKDEDGRNLVWVHKDLGAGVLKINERNPQNCSTYYCEPYVSNEWRTVTYQRVDDVVTVILDDGTEYSGPVDPDVNPCYFTIYGWGGNRPRMKDITIFNNLPSSFF